MIVTVVRPSVMVSDRTIAVSRAWQRRQRILRPFDQADAVGQRLVETEFVEFGYIGQPVEVEMRNGNAQIVALHQRKGRARDFEAVVVGHGTQESARQRRFAGAEIAGKRQAVAGLQGQRQVLAELDGGRLVLQEECDRPASFRRDDLREVAGRDAAGDFRAFAFAAADRHRAVVQADEALDDRKAKAGAAALAHGFRSG